MDLNQESLLIKSFQTKIEAAQLVANQDCIIVALSGGLDSVALLLLLNSMVKKFNLKLYPMYVHHHLRQDADLDVSLCQSLCDRLNIELRVVHVDVKKAVLEEKCSEEEAGRNLRYKSFYAYGLEIGAQTIALAHHRDDQCETVLHRLIRGTGLLGLSGMRWKNGMIIRPLLDFDKETLKEYVHYKGEPNVEDYTNTDITYTRNHIRHGLIPYLRDNFNPNIVNTLFRLSQSASEDEDFLEMISQKKFEEIVRTQLVADSKVRQVSLSCLEILKLHPSLQKRVLKKCIAALKGNTKNLEYNHIQRVIELLEQSSGKQVDIVDDIIAIKEFDQLRIIYRNQLLESHIGFAQTLDMKTDKGYIQSAKIAYASYYYANYNYKDSFKISQNAYTKSFDCDRIENTLTLRTRKSGDFIHIDREGHKKTLKKFFVDEKIPLSIRDSIPLLAMDNRILWVVGYRTNPIFEATPDSKKIFVLELTKEEVNGNN